MAISLHTHGLPVQKHPVGDLVRRYDLVDDTVGVASDADLVAGNDVPPLDAVLRLRVLEFWLLERSALPVPCPRNDDLDMAEVSGPR